MFSLRISDDLLKHYRFRPSREGINFTLFDETVRIGTTVIKSAITYRMTFYLAGDIFTSKVKKKGEEGRTNILFNMRKFQKYSYKAEPRMVAIVFIRNTLMGNVEEEIGNIQRETLHEERHLDAYSVVVTSQSQGCRFTI